MRSGVRPANNGFGIFVFRPQDMESILDLDRPVTLTFSVRAVVDDVVRGRIEDSTPATCTFVIRPRAVPRGPAGQVQPGLEDETFTDPTPGQPFKYFREEPD